MKKSTSLFLIELLVLAYSLLFISCNNSGKRGEKTSPLDSIYQEIDNLAEEINAIMLDTTEKFHEGLKSIEVDGKKGFIDTQGNIVIQPQFDCVGCFNEGLVSVTIGANQIRYATQNGDSATAWQGGKQGFVDRTGKFVIEPTYDYCNFFSQGVAVVAKDGKWGYVDKNGKEITPIEYDRAESFWDSDGFAAVCKDGKWGLINIKGEVVVPLEHKGASSTQSGEACVFPFDENIICYHIYNDGKVMVESIK